MRYRPVGIARRRHNATQQTCATVVNHPAMTVYSWMLETRSLLRATCVELAWIRTDAVNPLAVSPCRLRVNDDDDRRQLCDCD